MQDLGELDGVCTFCEMAVPLVSRIAETLGLPGNSPAAVDAARDKHSTRATMAAAGLPTPRNMLIQQPSDISAAAEKVKFPAGAKPHKACPSMLSLLLAMIRVYNSCHACVLVIFCAKVYLQIMCLCTESHRTGEPG